MALATVGIGLVAVGGLAADFFFKAGEYSKEYQRQVALTKTQVDGFEASQKQLSEVGLQAANNIAVPLERMQVELYDIFSSTNANLKQGQMLLDLFSKEAVAGQVDIQEAGRGTIAILNAFHLPLEDATHILDVQFQLVRKGVGTFGDFAGVIGRIIPSATRAGQSFETVGGMLAYMTRNGLSAAMAATSGARALDAMSNPKTQERLVALGIKVRDVQGNFLPLIDVLTQIRSKLMALPKPEQVAMLQELFKGSGGTIQARRFLDQVLLNPGQLEQFASFLKDMSNATGQFQSAYNQMADTAAARTQLLSNRWKVLKERVGELIVPYLLDLTSWLSKILDWFNKLSPATQKYVVLATALGAVIAIAGGAFLLLLGGLAMAVGAIAAAGTQILVVTGIIAGVAVTAVAAGLVLKDMYDHAYLLRTGLRDLSGEGEKLRDLFVGAFDKIRNSYDKNLRPALNDLKFVIYQEIEPAFEDFQRQIWDRVYPKLQALVDKVSEFADWTLKNLHDTIENDVIPALKNLEEFYRRHQKAIDDLIADVTQLVYWLGLLIIALGKPGVKQALLVVAVSLAGFVAMVEIAISSILFWVEVINRIPGALAWARRAMFELAATVISKIAELLDWIDRLWRKISGAFADLPSALFSAGANAIQGLINGMLSKLGSVIGAAATIAGEIASHFPSSPAKKGPLSGRGHSFFSGQRIVRSLADGIMSEMSAAERSSNAIAAQLSIKPGMGVTTNDTSRVVGVSSSSGASIVVNVYPKSSSADPHVLGAQIGWEVQNRLGVVT